MTSHPHVLSRSVAAGRPSRRARLVLGLTALAAAGGAVGLARRGGGGAQAARPAAAATVDEAPAGQVARIRYRLSYQQEVLGPGLPPVTVAVSGAWTTAPRVDGRVEATLTGAEVSGPAGAMPAAAELAVPMQLERDQRGLLAIALPDGTVPAARALLTGVATTFQVSERPGPSWAVTEDDLYGRYQASYTRAGGSLARTRSSYLAAEGRPAVTASERSTFEVDARGVVSAQVAIELTITLDAKLPPTRTRVTGRLEREAIEWIAPVRGARLASAPVAAQVAEVDPAEARMITARAMVADRTTAQLLSEAMEVADLDPAAKGTGQARANALARLSAAVYVDPSAAAEIAEVIRQDADDVSEARLLSGALASAERAEATDALAGLVTAELPDETHGVVIGALSTSDPPTEASLAALRGSLDRSQPRQAAFGLGSHIRRAAGELSDEAAAGTRELLDRYAAAASDDERVRYLLALGNAGDPAALPLLAAVVRGGDPALAPSAVFALRFLAGAEVDALLADALTRLDLAFAAVRAVGYRDRAAWAARLAETRARFPEHEGIQRTVRQLLGEGA